MALVVPLNKFLARYDHRRTRPEDSPPFKVAY